MKGTVVMRFVGNKQEPEEYPVKCSDILFAVSEQRLEFEKFFEEFKQREIERIAFVLGIGPFSNREKLERLLG